MISCVKFWLLRQSLAWHDGFTQAPTATVVTTAEIDTAASYMFCINTSHLHCAELMLIGHSSATNF